MLPNNKGYTLTELVVTILIIGVLYLVTFWPKNAAIFDKTNIESSTHQLRSDLRRCRAGAINTNLAHKLVIQTNTNIYYMYSKHPTQNTWVQNIKTYSLPSGNVLATSLPNSQIIFSSSGIPYEDPVSDLPAQSLDNNLTVTRSITIFTHKGTTSNIQIIPETGYIL